MTPGSHAPKPVAAKNAERLPCLDGIRVIAVLLIICAHAFANWRLPHWLTTATGALFKGGLGVQIFFTLSGFLITMILLKEKDHAGQIDLRSFYIRRVARILPASYLYLATLAILAVLGWIAISRNNILSSALYVVNYQRTWRNDDGIGYWFVGHLWTLCVEQQYYLLWPLAVMTCSKTRLAKFTLAVILSMPVLRVAHYYLFPAIRPQLGLFFHTGADCIFVGSLAAIFATEPWNLRARIGKLHWIWAALAGAWLVWGTVWSRETLGGWWNVGFARIAISFSAILLLLWLTGNPQSILGRLLESRAMIYVSGISYATFLWQQLFLSSFGTSSLLSIFLAVASAFVASIWSHELIEKPCNDWARQRFSHHCSKGPLPSREPELAG